MSDSNIRDDSDHSQKTGQAAAFSDRQVPFIKTVLIGLCVAFIVLSSIQLFVLNEKIFEFEASQLDAKLDSLYSQASGESQLRWWTASKLEVYAINQRYHQAHVSLMSRLWIQYLSFLMGIILTTIGAVFVFGKVRDIESSVDVENKWFGRILFRSTSPGLFVAFFGILLTVFSFIYQREITVTDRSVYLNSFNLTEYQRKFGIKQPDTSMFSGDGAEPDPGAGPPPDATGKPSGGGAEPDSGSGPLPDSTG